jgi:hypothetical protein
MQLDEPMGLAVRIIRGAPCSLEISGFFHHTRYLLLCMALPDGVFKASICAA